jgi:hypothetical protein
MVEGGRIVVEQQQEKCCARRSYSTPSKSPHTQHHAVSFIHTLTLLTLDLDLVYINGPMLLLITALVVVICHLCCVFLMHYTPNKTTLKTLL